MINHRVIPVLLLEEGKLIKTVRFKNPTYVGDPINAVRIFNEKEVDEMVILDRSASRGKNGPDFPLLEKIVSEAFMPLGYGGGVRHLEDARKLFRLGLEKVIVNSLLLEQPGEVRKMVETYGSQSIVACLDYGKTFLGGQRPSFYAGTKNIKTPVPAFARELENMGFGEIIIQAIDRDGTGEGYDIDMLKEVSAQLNIPVVVCGGAATSADFRKAFENGASACAAGSMFVFQGKHRAVLISYTNQF